MRLKTSIGGVLSAVILSGCAGFGWDGYDPENNRSDNVDHCIKVENKDDPACSGNYQAPAPKL